MMKDEKLKVLRSLTVYPCRTFKGQNMENYHCKRHCSLKENILMCDPVGYKEIAFNWRCIIGCVGIVIGLGAIYLIGKYLI